MEELLNPIIDVVCLFEIIQEEQDLYYSSELDVDLNRIMARIKEAREMKKKYLNLLN